MKRRLCKRYPAVLPAEEAFRLFTPRGECEWAPGWDPTFPALTDDDSEPGTVFQIDAHGHRGTWLVTDRERGRRIAYAQVVPGHRAGSVTVTLDAIDGGSEVEVVYGLRLSARRVSTTSSSSPRTTAIFCGRGRTRSRHASSTGPRSRCDWRTYSSARRVTWAILLKSRASRHR